MNAEYIQNLLTHDTTISTKRVEYIDLAKGVAIFMIVALHSGIYIPMMMYIAMPMFFVVSGMFFKDKGLGITLRSKVVRLIIPLIVFNFIGMIYHYFEAKYLSSEPIEFDVIGSLLYLELYNAALWFLAAILIDTLIFLIIVRLTKRKILIALIVVGITTLNFIGINLPLTLRESFVSLPFFFMGYCMQGSMFLRDVKRADWRVGLVGLLIIFGCSLFLRYVHSPEIGYINGLIKGNVLALYGECMLCVTATLLICQHLRWVPLLSYFGQFSLIVVCVHLLYINFFMHIAQKYIPDELTRNVLVLTVVTVLCIVSVPLLRKYMPYVVAEKDVFKLITKYRSERVNTIGATTEQTNKPEN